MRKNGLDEMQIQRRDRIGNQAFMMLFYLLMLDIGLSGFGFKWLSYPVNVFVMMLFCMTYYLVRVIWNNAYIGPCAVGRPKGRVGVLVVAIVALISAAAVFLTQRNSLNTPVIDESDNGAFVLFIFSLVAIIIAVTVNFISKKQSKDGE